MDEIKQQPLFEGYEQKEPWEDEWKGMPEYIMKDLSAPFTLEVNFRNEKDLNEFLDLVGQKLHSDSKSIWYPKMDLKKWSDKQYSDEEQTSDLHN